jgi:outer membrane protein assembly factor BamB
MTRASGSPSNWALIVLALPLLLISCGKPASPAATAPSAPAQTASAPAAAAVPQQAPAPVPSLPAEVIFTNGDVQGQIQGTWSPLDIGARLSKGDSVKVGAASECQLKLADLAVVDIQENTQVSVDSLALAQTGSRAKLSLQSGTLLSKVKKLAGTESYAVRTSTAVGGVRGTEFGVTVTPQGNTLVTVKDGTVAVLPAAYDPDTVREMSSTANPDLEQIAQTIESSATPVNAGQELAVTPQQARKAQADFQAIREAAAQIVQEEQVQAAAQASGNPKPAGPPAAVVEARNKAVQAATATLATVVSKPTALSPVNTRKLRALDTLPPPSAPAPAAVSSAPQKAPAPAPVVKPVTVAVSATPSDAAIEINGKAAGTGSYSAAFNPGQTVTIVIRHEGYATKTIALTAKEAASYPVTLEPAPIEASFAVSTQPVVRSVQASGDVVIAVDRQGAIVGTDRRGRAVWKIATQNAPNENSSPVLGGGTIYFTGAKEFIVANARTGAVASRTALDSTTTHLFGQRVAVSSSFGVYPTSSALTIFDPSTGATVRQVAVPGGTLMTPAITEDGKVLVVSQTGIFLAIDPTAGQVLYQVPTGASQPVASSVLVSGSRAFFADRKGMLVCVDMDAHKVLWKATLKGTGNMGVFQDLEKSADGVFAFAGSTIFGFSAADGSELFPPISGAATPPLERDGKLYFGTPGGALQVADDKTGKALKTLELKTVLSARPHGDGPRLLLGSSTGQVLVVYPDSIP